MLVLSRKCQQAVVVGAAGGGAPLLTVPAEEVLVTDARAGLTTADMVERKLQYLLRGASVAGSHVRMGGPRVRGSAPG